MSDDKDKIIGKDMKTGSFVNGRGEALKFTKKSMSIYSNTPDKPHDGMHLNYDKDGKTLTITTHNKDKSEKSTSDIDCYLTTACMKHYLNDFDDNVVDYCVTAIENGNYTEAYRRYKDSIINLEQLYIKKELGKRLIKTLN